MRVTAPQIAIRFGTDFAVRPHAAAILVSDCKSGKPLGLSLKSANEPWANSWANACVLVRCREAETPENIALNTAQNRENNRMVMLAVEIKELTYQ